ncbi:MAG TPA: DUF559 domain-containing protein [Phenylobacterium sp.]
MRPPVVRAREFRRTMSEPEVLLWSRLKRLRDRGFHIRRQAPFKGYYLDFVCYPRRVAIEVDGAQHAEDAQADRDIVRDRILRAHGFTVLRFSTTRVRRDLDGVMDQIIAALEAAPSTRPANLAEPGLDHTSPP